MKFCAILGKNKELSIIKDNVVDMEPITFEHDMLLEMNADNGTLVSASIIKDGAQVTTKRYFELLTLSKILDIDGSGLPDLTYSSEDCQNHREAREALQKTNPAKDLKCKFQVPFKHFK